MRIKRELQNLESAKILLMIFESERETVRLRKKFIRMMEKVYGNSPHQEDERYIELDRQHRQWQHRCRQKREKIARIEERLKGYFQAEKGNS